MIWIGYEIGLYFGWKRMDAIFLGAMLAVSSTTIIVKALNELGMKNEKFAQIIFGILIVEDILAIGMIALLSGWLPAARSIPAKSSRRWASWCCS
jgi:CPA2 family monovalent cation:H+ antiporter-2